MSFDPAHEISLEFDNRFRLPTLLCVAKVYKLNVRWLLTLGKKHLRLNSDKAFTSSDESIIHTSTVTSKNVAAVNVIGLSKRVKLSSLSNT